VDTHDEGPKFTPRPINMGFVTDKSALGLVLLRVLMSFHVGIIPIMFHVRSFYCDWHYKIAIDNIINPLALNVTYMLCAMRWSKHWTLCKYICCDMALFCSPHLNSCLLQIIVGI